MSASGMRATAGMLLGAGGLVGAVMLGAPGCEGSCEDKRNCGPYDGVGSTTSSSGGTAASSSSAGGGGAGGAGGGPGGAPPVGRVRIAAGGDHACALRGERVFCWGKNDDGQLGDGSFNSSAVPVEVAGLASPFAVEAGTDFTCALTGDDRLGGRVYCWGSSSAGQRGDGTFADSNVPIEVAGLNNVTKIDLGNTHVCALTAAGQVYCWGSGTGSKLGTGSPQNEVTPQQVSGFSSALDIVASNNASCVVTSQGRMECVGIAPLGDNQGTPSSSFVQVLLDNSLDVFDKVASSDGGGQHICALEQTGLIRCWGDNGFGQLGDGSTLDRFGAKEILGFNARSVTAGGGHSCALDTSSRVFCWGNSVATGVGAAMVPTQVPGVPAVEDLATGNEFTCAIAADGVARCWGFGTEGQLGNGTFSNSNGPVEVLLP